MGKGLTFTVVAVAVGAALYAGLGYVAVPQGARYALEKIAAEKLQRPVTVGEVSFSPWSWTFELSDLTVGSRTGQHHLLKLDHLRVDASSRSLLEFAPVLDAVEVSGLDVFAALDEEKFDELAPKADSAPAEESPAEAGSAMPAFAVYNIRLSDSRIRVTDAAKGIDESITDLRIELPFVSTLSSARESLLTPVVNFNLNGTPVAATGRTKPFGSSLETELALDVKNLDAARFARIAPALNSPELRLASANLTAHASVLFRNPTGGEPAKIILSGQAVLTDVKAETTVGKKRAQLAALKKASIDVREVNLVEQLAAVSNIRVEGLTAALDRSNPLLAAKADDAPEADSAAAGNAAARSSESSVWTWSLDSAELVDANLRWTDDTVSPAAKVSVANLKADLKNLSSNGKDPASFSLSADTLRGTIALNGTVRPAPLEVTVKAKGQKLALTDATGYVRDALGVDLTATTAFEIDGAMRPDATTARGTVSVSGVSLKKGKETLASVNSASVELKNLQLEKRTASVGRVVVDGASVTAVLRKSGLNLAQIGAKETSENGKAESPATAEKPSEAPWTWSVAEAALKRSKLAFRDETVKPVASAQLTDLNVTLKNLASTPGAKSLLDVSTVLGGGTLNAGGHFTLSPLSAAVEIKADKVGLKSFSNLMTAYAGVGAKSGEFRASGALGIASTGKAEKPVVTWKGDASLANFNMTNAAGKGILSWTKATLAGMDIATTDPIKVVVSKASVEQPGEKQTKIVRELSGLASAIAALRGNDKTAERIDKVNETLSGTIELENIRYENGRFSAEGIGNGALGAVLLEKLSDSIGSHLVKTEIDSSATKR